VLGVEKRQHKAKSELNRPAPIVRDAQTSDMFCRHEALDHLQKQALKYKTKWLSKKRKASRSLTANRWKQHRGALGLAEALLFSLLVHNVSISGRATTEVASRACLQESGRAPSADLGRSVKKRTSGDKDVFVLPDPQGS